MINSLFSPGDDWQNNACLDWSHDSIVLYINGYRKAADLLVRKVADTSSNQNILVYPIAFLYRQYIELQLKYIIRESRILLSDGSGFPEHHKIKALWDVANGLMKRIVNEVDPSAKDYIARNDVNEIGGIINQFNETDPESFAFRYPRDKKGNNNLEGLTHINLRNLRDQMDLLVEKLNKYDLVVGLLRDWQSEMRAEHAP